MKYCPECKANTEGLLSRCDCCGASLEQEKKHLIKCGIYELPQCLGFSNTIRELINAIQPQNIDEYSDFLECIGISVICYPEWMLESGNIKNRVRYSKEKKYMSLTITVDFDSFVKAAAERDNNKKYRLVANALLSGIYSIQKRLSKSKLNINGIVKKAETEFAEYIN